MIVISIIVPMYNVERYISKCLKSIVEQSIPKKSYEIIVIDDGSTDKSGTIADEFAKHHDNLRVIHKKNEGQSLARKLGVEVAKGEYIGFIDADDWVDKDMFSGLYKAIKEENADIACCNYVLDFEDGRDSKVICSNKKWGRYDSKGALSALHKRLAIYQFSWNKLYRRDLFKDMFFPKHHLLGEDYAMVVQALLKSKQIVQVDNAYYHYLQRKGSTCKAGYNENHYRSYENYEEIYELIMESYPEIQQEVINYQIQEGIYLIIPMSRNGVINKDLIKKLRKKIYDNFISYFCTSRDGLQVKGAVVIFLLSPRFLLWLYSMLYKKNFRKEL